jgi:hypothetical protein
MSAPIPLRQDFDVSQLRSLARRTKDGPQARRLLTLAAIYDGATRTEAAKIGGVGLQIIWDWVLRFNARGPDALLNVRPVRLATGKNLAFFARSLLAPDGGAPRCAIHQWPVGTPAQVEN